VKTVLEFLVMLIRVFLPAVIEAARPTSADADPNVELRDELRRKVLESWGR